MPQPVCCYKQADDLQRIITCMDDETCYHSSRHGAREGENNSNEYEQSDLAPSSPQLRRMEQAEQRTSRDDSPGFSESTANYWINVAAENRLFHQRSDQNSNRHEQHCGVAIVKESLDGQVLLWRK